MEDSLATGTGVPRQRSSVRFAGAAASPAMTPSWKANAWAGGPGADAGHGAGDASPELRGGGETDGLLDAEWQANEKQLDREWYDRCAARHTRCRLLALTDRFWDSTFLPV